MPTRRGTGKAKAEPDENTEDDGTDRTPTKAAGRTRPPSRTTHRRTRNSTTTGETEPDEAELDEAELDEAELDEAELDEAEPDRIEADGTESDGRESDRAESDRTESDRTESDRSESDRAESDGTGLDGTQSEEAEERDLDAKTDDSGRGARRASDEDADGDRAVSGADGMSAMEAARAGVQQIVALISKRPEGVTSVEPTDDGWLVQVEVLEDRHVPSSSDVLGLYDIRLDDEGELRSYRRVKRYVRGRGSEEGA